MSLVEEYHKRTDHGREGYPLDGGAGLICNCRLVVAQHNEQLLAPVLAAIKKEEDSGFGNYVKPIRRAVRKLL